MIASILAFLGGVAFSIAAGHRVSRKPRRAAGKTVMLTPPSPPMATVRRRPRIRLWAAKGARSRWVCFTEDGAMGWGRTPAKAHREWQQWSQF